MSLYSLLYLFFFQIFVRPRFCQNREVYVRIFIGTRPYSEVETRQPMGAGYSIAPSAPMQGGYQYGAVGGATGPPIPYQHAEPTAPLKDDTVRKSYLITSTTSWCYNKIDLM